MLDTLCRHFNSLIPESRGGPYVGGSIEGSKDLYPVGFKGIPVHRGSIVVSLVGAKRNPGYDVEVGG